MAVMGLLHSSGLPVMTAHVAILSLGSPARRPRAMASMRARYWGSEYLLGSLPTSAEVTSGLLLEGPKALAKAWPYARASRAGSFHLAGATASKMRQASISNPALFHEAYIVPQGTP